MKKLNMKIKNENGNEEIKYENEKIKMEMK